MKVCSVIVSERGSALLVALLLMGFLAVFGLGMSRLIVDSIRVERNVVEAGKSYFAAEAAIERGLYFHENRIPGYQVQDDEEAVSEWTLKNGAEVQYKMIAAGSKVPCHSGEEWRILQEQESVSWPLFRWDSDEGQVEMGAFTLEFKSEVVGAEVLRWKIFGLTDNGNTQAISGLLTAAPTGNELTETSRANFYDGEPGGTFVNYPDYLIRTFLENHSFNYLTLTNLAGFPLQVQLSIPEGQTTACEVTQIRAVGESGGTRQNIDAELRLNSFLPVFNFVLYQVGDED